MKVHIRFMESEVVNYWVNDAPDYDEIQREITLNLKTIPKFGEEIKRKNHPSLKVTKVIESNEKRKDGLVAFVQAKIT